MPGAERLGEVGGQILDPHPDAAALDLAVIDELVHDLAGHVDRDGKTDADIAAAGRQDRRIDADDPALQVDQWTARIAGVDRRVGLDEILVAFDAETAAPERADDARGHGLAETERVADRQHEIADLQPVGIADRDRGQTSGGNLQHGDVGVGVAADQFRGQPPIVLGGDFDAVCILDDVRIGHHIALRGVDDHTRTGRLRLALDRLLLEIEKAAKHRVLQQRVVLFYPPPHRDADDTRSDPADHWRQCLHRRAISQGYRRSGEDRRNIARRQGDSAGDNER